MFKEITSSTLSDNLESAVGIASRVAGYRGVLRELQKGELLFVEGDADRGIFLIRTGRVKLSTSLPDGRLVIVYIAEAGSILGLSAVFGRCEHEVTAEAIEPTRAEFITGDTVRSLLRSDAAFAFRAADEMARRYRSAHSLACTLAKSDPILVKLARLVTDWLSERGNGKSQIDNVFTHQQIAEMLGTTRETVTRSFKHLRECGILTLKGHLLVVHDMHKLRLLADDCDVSHRL
jgi:CRP/FNR family cyclic AMP-dependent transcriptional regulator